MHTDYTNVVVEENVAWVKKIFKSAMLKGLSSYRDFVAEILTNYFSPKMAKGSEWANLWLAVHSSKLCINPFRYANELNGVQQIDH